MEDCSTVNIHKLLMVSIPHLYPVPSPGNSNWIQIASKSIQLFLIESSALDYRKIRSEQAPIYIDGAEVEQVESFKFLGVRITNKLSWFKHTKTVVNSVPLRRLKRFGMGP